MNNKQLSTYANISLAETKDLFNPIRDAFDDLGLGDITSSMADLYLHAAPPANYHNYLNKLNAVKLVSEQGGFQNNIAERIVKSGFYDPWVMLFSAAKYYLEEDLPENFYDLVIHPSDMLIKAEEKELKQKKEAIEKARKMISEIMDPLEKVFSDLDKLPSSFLLGTKEEDIKYKIKNIIALR